MGNYTLYKSHKSYVAPMIDVPKSVREFITDYDGDVYLEDEDTLKDLLEEDLEKFKTVKEYWDKHELWGWDLEVQYD